MFECCISHFVFDMRKTDFTLQLAACIYKKINFFTFYLDLSCSFTFFVFRSRMSTCVFLVTGCSDNRHNGRVFNFF
jgi:hypothetical protein